jgi:hypothetical protein
VIGLIAWTIALPPIAPIQWNAAGEGGVRAAGSATPSP